LIAGVFLPDNILLLGGSGNLGTAIIQSNKFKNILYPKKNTVNILNKKKIINFLIENKIQIIIHAAGLARVRDCEKFKKKANKINIDGTNNVVNSIIYIKKKLNINILLIYISSDAVYSSTKGNYKEIDTLRPYNHYGITKMKAEKKVRRLKKFIIIRTRFFNKNKIPFKYSANNIFSSSIEVNRLVSYIKLLIKKKFYGIINVGGKRVSDYNNYKKYKKNLIKCDKSKIFAEVNFVIATDASLNINKLKNL
jgi:dTDP-4-dehydrorhamnose reductase